MVGDDANAFLQYVSNNTDSGVDPRLCVLGIDDVEEVATVAGASFAGTATKDPELMMDWACGPKLQGQWDDVSPELPMIQL